MIAGFQQKVSKQIDGAFPGDILSSRTAILQAANGKFSATELTVGNFCFGCADGISVANSQDKAGENASIAGFIPRSQASMGQSWGDIEKGYSTTIPVGKQVSIVDGGDLAALVTGVDGYGKPDHEPKAGEQIHVSVKDGSIVASKDDVDGYIRVVGITISNTNITNISTPVKEFQKLCQLSGQILRGV
ncbi:structural cement protein Gp24 [Francisella tularensis]|uniref:structural cement protein Gp24 n=1 Tax=Francisella tularensis TaxID=263 RepID=UPI0008F51B38|nr:hypothetical protein [Francisella tularensis]APA83232.1 hypothetical protein N894_1248 [Francisella tularensis subsp. novicida PA10-7858]